MTKVFAALITVLVMAAVFVPDIVRFVRTHTEDSEDK